jgi:hypothetical protein
VEGGGADLHGIAPPDRVDVLFGPARLRDNHLVLGSVRAQHGTVGFDQHALAAIRSDVYV